MGLNKHKMKYILTILFTLFFLNNTVLADGYPQSLTPEEQQIIDEERTGQLETSRSYKSIEEINQEARLQDAQREDQKLLREYIINELFPKYRNTTGEERKKIKDELIFMRNASKKGLGYIDAQFKWLGLD